VIVDAANGYVLTNNHVIDKAQQITVTLSDGREFGATLVGADPEADVAVIQIPAEKLSALPFSNSETLRVGDFVVAIGNPFGLGQTVTSGIVSALGRTGLGIEGYEDFIQTDASINPGNSGGALVNLRGELVGVNTAIVAPGGGNVGIGFAIPINMARELMNQLIEFGEIQRGRLGIGGQTLSPELAKAFNIACCQGVVISRVEEGSAAEKAGLKVGDIVLAFNGRTLKDSADLRNALGLVRAGGEIQLQVMRDGQKRLIKAKVEAPKQERFEGRGLSRRLDGAVFGSVTKESSQSGQIDGLVLLEVVGGSPVWQAGLRQGDLIVSVNRQRVTNREEIERALKLSDEAILLNVRRGNQALFVLLQ
jgi:serine protease Do/serine protease DegQ